jgi:hypothetical protein
VIHVGNNGDVANTRIQIENSSGLRIGAYYYFTMAEALGYERSEGPDFSSATKQQVLPLRLRSGSG